MTQVFTVKVPGNLDWRKTGWIMWAQFGSVRSMQSRWE